MKRRLLAVLIGLMLLAGCGQKGPLYRPGHPGQPVPAASLAVRR